MYFLHYAFIIFPLACNVEEVFSAYCNVIFVQEFYYILEPDATFIVYCIVRFC